MSTYGEYIRAWVLGTYNHTGAYTSAHVFVCSGYTGIRTSIQACPSQCMGVGIV